MNKEFVEAFKQQVSKNGTGCGWQMWCGEFMLYDGGLFVNRTAEEQAAEDINRYREVYFK